MARRSLLQRIPAVGETWQVAGMWTKHPKHGWQVEMQEATLVRPSGRLLVDALAGNSAFPGIGPMRAQAVWDAHGDDVFDLLDAGRADALEPILGADLARVLIAPALGG
jgi:hypothetical protein